MVLGAGRWGTPQSWHWKRQTNTKSGPFLGWFGGLVYHEMLRVFGDVGHWEKAKHLVIQKGSVRGIVGAEKAIGLHAQADFRGCEPGVNQVIVS